MKQYVIALTALLLAVSCTERRAAVTDDVQPDSAALVVAVMPTLDCLPVFLASSHGVFDREGLQVRLESYRAQMDCDTAIANGHVQAAFTDIVRAMRMQQRQPLRMVAATNLCWQLLSNKAARIRRLTQMEDKMMAMTRFSATHMLSDMAVDSARLLPEKVFRIQVNDVGVRLNMLETGIMDAMFLPEPQATQARMEGHRVLLDTRTLDVRQGVLVFTERALADTVGRHRMEVFCKVYDMMCDSINQNGLKAYADVVARFCHVKAGIIDSIPDTDFVHARPPRQSDIDRAKAWADRQ